MSVTIRKAKKEDSDFLANIFLESRRSAFSWEDPAKFKLEDFYNQTEGEIIFLAEDSHKKILGFISIWEQDSFIHHLFISPEHQKKGIGTLLLNSLTPWLPLPWKLKCLTKNKPALNFYKKNGWIEIEQNTSNDGNYVLMELSK
jgi:GNAT superfamily N-acetyltransferase